MTRWLSASSRPARIDRPEGLTDEVRPWRRRFRPHRRNVATVVNRPSSCEASLVRVLDERRVNWWEDAKAPDTFRWGGGGAVDDTGVVAAKSTHQSRLEVPDDRHDSTVVQVVVLDQIKLHEDVGHVFLDCAQ